VTDRRKKVSRFFQIQTPFSFRICVSFVTPECALQNTLELLRKVVDEMCDYPIFIVSPITRCPCCNAEDHVTNFNDPDFLGSILRSHEAAVSPPEETGSRSGGGWD
jgi:hypothetical protein